MRRRGREIQMSVNALTQVAIRFARLRGLSSMNIMLWPNRNPFEPRLRHSSYWVYGQAAPVRSQVAAASMKSP